MFGLGFWKGQAKKLKTIGFSFLISSLKKNVLSSNVWRKNVGAGVFSGNAEKAKLIHNNNGVTNFIIIPRVKTNKRGMFQS